MKSSNLYLSATSGYAEDPSSIVSTSTSDGDKQPPLINDYNEKNQKRCLSLIRRCFTTSSIPFSPSLNVSSDPEILKNIRICRSEPSVVIGGSCGVGGGLCGSVYLSPKKTVNRRSSCRRRTANTATNSSMGFGKCNEGVVNILRRRALSRHFSNSFASSLDISSASQSSSSNTPQHHQQPSLLPINLLMLKQNMYFSNLKERGAGGNPIVTCLFDNISRSASSGYASRRSSLTGSPSPVINDLQPGTNWSDNSGCVAHAQNLSLIASSTPKSTSSSINNNHDSFRSLFTGVGTALPGDESDIEYDQHLGSSSLVGQLYSARFPRLKQQMERRLKSLIGVMEEELDCKNTRTTPIKSDGAGRFIYSQLLELAKDCLKRCGVATEVDDEQSIITDEIQNDGSLLLSSSVVTNLNADYFNDLSDNLQRILRDCKDKLICSNISEANKECSHQNTFNVISSCIDEFLMAVARTADILECLESNPDEFYSALTVIESQLKNVTQPPNARDIPHYLLSQLKTSISLNGQSTYARLLDEYKNLSQRDETQNQQCDNYYVNTLPHIHDFEIVKSISSGAYGSVYLVKHKGTSRYMALKRLGKKSICRKNFIQQVFTERDILTFIQNPFVVSLFCSFETDQDLCLVMEYVEGGDVRSLLDYLGGPLSLDMTTLYFAETTLAVEYIHSYGIIHRDIKPSNLLITACGHIKLTDFGLSKIGLTDLTSSQFHDNQVIGTPQYIAPEVILRIGYGQPVDMWSMGVVLYEMLIGCTPFVSDDVEELFELIINGEIDFPEYLDDTYAKDLIEALLTRTVNQRPHSIRHYPFFIDIDWEQLLVRKAKFIPTLSGPDDTSYFKPPQQANPDSNFNRSADLFSDAENVTPYFSFSSYSPSFISNVNSSRMFGHCDSDSGGSSMSSSNQNLSLKSSSFSSPILLKDDCNQGNDVDPPSTDQQVSGSSTHSVKQTKNKRFRGSLSRARSFFLRRVLTAEKKINNILKICINRHTTLGYGFTFATYTISGNSIGNIGGGSRRSGSYAHLILSITPNGPAFNAGLLKDHKILQINERDVTCLTHSNVVRIVQKCKHVLDMVLSCTRKESVILENLN